MLSINLIAFLLWGWLVVPLAEFTAGWFYGWSIIKRPRPVTDVILHHGRFVHPHIPPSTWSVILRLAFFGMAWAVTLLDVSESPHTLWPILIFMGRFALGLGAYWFLHGRR